ncbi:MAG: hypothetical protein IKV43_06540, partial [Clostridia bacterium]|nr:hypothetical protein [Clostridia bacterium]
MSKKQYNPKHVFVVFNPSVQGELLASDCEYNGAVLDYYIDYMMITFYSYVLDCGDVSRVPYSNKAIYKNLTFDPPHNVQRRIARYIKKIEALDKDVIIHLFVEANRIEEICGLYYFSNLFIDFNNVLLHTVAFNDIDFSKRPLINIGNGEPLTKEKLLDFSERWKRLADSNADIRYIKNGEILELSLADAKKLILPFFSEEFKHYPKILLNFIEQYKEEYPLSFLSIDYIVMVLLD